MTGLLYLVQVRSQQSKIVPQKQPQQPQKPDSHSRILKQFVDEDLDEDEVVIFAVRGGRD